VLPTASSIAQYINRAPADKTSQKIIRIPGRFWKRREQGKPLQGTKQRAECQMNGFAEKELIGKPEKGHRY
jgi:hypothetical protein